MDDSRPSEIDAATAEDFAALGVTVEAVEADEHCEVWDVNWPSVLIFLALETQWRCVARGTTGVLLWLGLDYGSVSALLSRRTKAERRRRSDAEVFADLCIMEREALNVMNAAS